MINRGRFVLLLVVPAVSFACAETPDAPPPRMPLADKVLLGTIAAGRAADAFTTHQFLVAGQESSHLDCLQTAKHVDVLDGNCCRTDSAEPGADPSPPPSDCSSLEAIHAAFIWNIVAHTIIPAPQTRRQLHIQPNACQWGF